MFATLRARLLLRQQLRCAVCVLQKQALLTLWSAYGRSFAEQAMQAVSTQGFFRKAREQLNRQILRCAASKRNPVSNSFRQT